MTELQQCVTDLAKAAVQAKEDGNEAMKLSQAALNLANARASLMSQS